MHRGAGQLVAAEHPVAEQPRRRARRSPAGCVRRPAWPRSTRDPDPARRGSAASRACRAGPPPSPRRRPGRCRCAARSRRPRRRRAAARPARPSRRAREPAIATRSLASVVRASFQPPSTSPTTHSSGTKTSSRKTSLNISSPVSSRSGRMSMPVAGHVDEEVGDPRVLLHVGVRPRQADPPVGLAGQRGPDLLAGEPPAGLGRPARRDALGPRAQRREVRARAGLAEQLAPLDLAAQRRADEPLALLVGAVVDDRRRGPGADLEVGARRPRRERAPRR